MISAKFTPTIDGVWDGVIMTRTPKINVVLEIREPDNWQLYPDKYEILDDSSYRLQAVDNSTPFVGVNSPKRR